MKLSDHQAEFLIDICSLIGHARLLGFKVTAGEFQRGIEQQRHYVETGRSKTMHSKHLEKLAADLNFFKVIPPMKEEIYINGLPPEDVLVILAPLGKYWESLSPLNRWGGNFDKDWSRNDPWVDVPHWERRV